MRLQNLGYAVTSYRAQGVTTGTAHVLVDSSMTRENLYVAMTRGRLSNRAYVAIDQPDALHSGPHPSKSSGETGKGVLIGVLAHVGAEPSAHEALAAEQDRWGSFAQLAAEYETIAAAAQHDRWALLLRDCGLTDSQADAAIESEAFGPLAAELRRAEANHHDVDALMPRLVRARGFDDADDVSAVLRHRVAAAAARPAGSGRVRQAPRLIAGLIPEARGSMSAEMAQALTERQSLMEERAESVLDAALVGDAAWTRSLGEPPADPSRRTAWRRAARTVAAYRDRFQIESDIALGVVPEDTSQKVHRARAESALRAISKLQTPRHREGMGRPLEKFGRVL